MNKTEFAQLAYNNFRKIDALTCEAGNKTEMQIIGQIQQIAHKACLTALEYGAEYGRKSHDHT